MAEDYPNLKSPKPDGERMRQQVDEALLAHAAGDRSERVVMIKQWIDNGGGCASCGGNTPGSLR